MGDVSSFTGVEVLENDTPGWKCGNVTSVGSDEGVRGVHGMTETVAPVFAVCGTLRIKLHCHCGNRKY